MALLGAKKINNAKAEEMFLERLIEIMLLQIEAEAESIEPFSIPEVG